MNTNSEVDVSKLDTIVEKKKRGRKPIELTEEVIQKREEQKKARNEKAKEYYRTIYMAIRDKSIRTQCKCGEMVLESNAARHRRSNKCIDKCRQLDQLESEDNIYYITKSIF